jgi:hypothetical protein
VTASTSSLTPSRRRREATLVVQTPGAGASRLARAPRADRGGIRRGTMDHPRRPLAARGMARRAAHRTLRRRASRSRATASSSAVPIHSGDGWSGVPACGCGVSVRTCPLRPRSPPPRLRVAVDRTTP